MNSIWTNDRPRIAAHDKQLPKKTEVVIIGGGMAGLLCSYLLEEAGVSNVVLESTEICFGQTEKTTAKITSQHGLIYSEISKIFDEKTAIQYGRINQRAIDEYERIIGRKGIDCKFERLPSYLYTETQTGAYLLEKEYLAAKRIGIKALLTDKTNLPFPVKGALKYENQAQFHPLKFLMGITGELQIYEHTPVLRVQGHRVITNRGEIQADNMIIATHFPFMNIPGYYFARMHQERSYVLAISTSEKEGQKRADLDGMYYGIDSQGLSFRNVDQAILIGGFSHRTGAIRKENPYDALRKRAGELWPGYKEIAAWAAQDCMTLDHLPYAGQFSRKTPDWYVATGFGKWGMTGSMVAALAIRDQILGEPHPEWDVLSPQRKWTMEAMKSLCKEAGHITKELLSFKRPRCPHLGCRLVWNSYERSWDCPCHGSRFRENGQLIDNPAQTGIKMK